MKIIWLETAILDLQSLRKFIAKDSPLAAKKIAKRLVQMVQLLVEQPAAGRPGRIHSTRELVVTGTPYIIPYRVKDNSIEILRVIHGAMQWPEEL